jgi:ribosome maturation factor RimP
MSSAAPKEVDGRLKQIVENAVSSRGVELIDLFHVRSSRRQIVRIVIDKVGGISVEDCAEVSRRVSADLDMAEAIPGRYTLEVSSPGLDRPLKTAADFRRKVSRAVSVRLAEPGLPPEAVEGTIDAVTDDSVTVGGQILPLDRIVEAKLIV